MASSSPHDRYQSPLAGRYASDEMQTIWSARHKFSIWRKIWLAVAQAQHECGLPVSQDQIDELRANLHVTDDDIAAAAKYEAELRHDVMAQVHAWGDRCPKARGIIHLGMTSQDINDNCELLLLHQATNLIRERAARLQIVMASFAEQWIATPALGFTHYQPAQPTTVGRRAIQWAYDLHCATQPFDATAGQARGLRGATGTQASYLALFDDDASKVATLEDTFRANMAKLLDEADAPLFAGAHPLVSQTYPRIFDAHIVSSLAAVCAVLHKCATDIRLLSNRKELDEPFAEKQIGSSAMPYKRNPMRCERVCGLARFVWNLVGNTFDTAATQWLERTLDDSANRRLTLPEAFLATDACLNIMTNVLSGLIVHEATVRKNLMAELPFMASENLMMEAVKRGKDRQEVHEAIRQHAQLAGSRVKDEGADNDLIERLRSEPLLEGVDLDAALDPSRYVGLAVQQTEAFINDYIAPLREKYGDRQDADDLKL